MKKWILLFLCMALTMQLCGCMNIIDNNETTAPSAEQTDPTPSTAPSAPEETKAPVSPAPVISLSMPYTTDVVRTGDGTVLFSHTYPDPVFYFDDTAVVQNVLVDLLNQIDSSSTESHQILNAAKDNYITHDPSTAWDGYFANVVYNVERIDQNALSLLGSHVSYQGGIHPSYIPKSVTYDLVTGNRLALQDILTDDYSTGDLCSLVLESLSSRANELYGDYKSIVTDQFTGSWLDNKDWYLSRSGLCFYFAPYDIAPFASGVIVAEIPYEKLTGILLNAYFPPESIPASGVISAVLFDQNATSQYSRFSEVILEPEGEKILLYTDSAVRDITITQGMWNEDGTVFLPEQMVYSANLLSGTDAILLQTYIPDTMPNLELRYWSGDAEVIRYISQSGEDGSILLITQS